MKLYSQRKREREFAEREAAGEDVFSAELTERSRGRIANAIKAVFDPASAPDAHYRQTIQFYRDVRQRVYLAEGTPGYITNPRAEAPGDLQTSIRHAGHELACACIEAAIAEAASGRAEFLKQGAELIEVQVEQILAEERIAMRLVEGRLVDFASEELHEEVVAPALRLLAGRDGWAGVETAYRKALEEIGRDPADAITDAGTALQEALTMAGASGNALGQLTKSARKRDILAPHDGALAAGVAKIMDWVSADRSEMGDGHNSEDARPEDAWLAVHVVGALILRLAEGEPRRTD